MKTAVDLFAGLGGNTQGAKKAGLQVIWAANHSRTAVDYHAVNNPETHHECQDLRQFDMASIPDCDLMMLSPECQGHTDARGKELPRHELSRSTAWVVVDGAEAKRPPFLLVENVEKFSKWLLFPQWRSCLEALGYSLSLNYLDAADHGIPQHRRRLYVIGTRSKHPIVLQLPRRDHRPVLDVLDVESGEWSRVDRPGRSKATLRRVKNGRRDHGDLFVMPYYSDGSGLTGRSVHRPIGTVTTIDRWAIVKGNVMRMLSVDEYRRIMSFDESTVLPPQKRAAVHLLGNATCPEKIADILVALKQAA
jgi:DNA (cytosine-5)-methyltransferase 1